MKKYPSPKNLSDSSLWYLIQNIHIDAFTSKEFKSWYSKVEKEFHNRKIKLDFICK